jgi:hypothetical protein
MEYSIRRVPHFYSVVSFGSTTQTTQPQLSVNSKKVWTSSDFQDNYNYSHKTSNDKLATMSRFLSIFLSILLAQAKLFFLPLLLEAACPLIETMISFPIIQRFPVAISELVILLPKSQILPTFILYLHNIIILFNA